jgi:hypothetical protein
MDTKGKKRLAYVQDSKVGESSSTEYVDDTAIRKSGRIKRASPKVIDLTAESPIVETKTTKSQSSPLKTRSTRELQQDEALAMMLQQEEYQNMESQLRDPIHSRVFPL